MQVGVPTWWIYKGQSLSDNASWSWSFCNSSRFALWLGGSTGLLFVYLHFRLIVGSIFGYLCWVEMTITTIGIMKI